MNSSSAPAQPLTPATADDIFELILDAHQGLTPAQSQALNHRLILTLAAEIGDAQRVRACIQIAQAAHSGTAR